MPSSSPASFDDAEHSGPGIGDASVRATHRIDSPHIAQADCRPRDQRREFRDPPQRGSETDAVANQCEVTDIFEVDPQAIRQAHEDDLIGFLQQWSEDLDQRSARLHADIATQERRERAFRLWMQNQRAEWEQKMDECQKLQRHAEVVARRLAFSG
jgi:hypothetical protein